MGALSPGWLSSLPIPISWMIQAVAPNSNFGTSMGVPSQARSLRNPFKLIPIFFVLWLIQCASDQVHLPLAIASGLGFQIVEDFTYIRQDMPEGFSYAVSWYPRSDYEWGRITGSTQPSSCSVSTWSFKRQKVARSWYDGLVLFCIWFWPSLSAIHRLAKSRQNSPLAIHSWQQ